MYQLSDWGEYEDGDENEDGLWEEDENSDFRWKTITEVD